MVLLVTVIAGGGIGGACESLLMARPACRRIEVIPMAEWDVPNRAGAHRQVHDPVASHQPLRAELFSGVASGTVLRDALGLVMAAPAIIDALKGQLAVRLAGDVTAEALDLTVVPVGEDDPSGANPGCPLLLHLRGREVEEAARRKSQAEPGEGRSGPLRR